MREKRQNYSWIRKYRRAVQTQQRKRNTHPHPHPHKWGAESCCVTSRVRSESQLLSVNQTATSCPVAYAHHLGELPSGPKNIICWGVTATGLCSSPDCGPWTPNLCEGLGKPWQSYSLISTKTNTPIKELTPFPAPEKALLCFYSFNIKLHLLHSAVQGQC